MTVSKTVIWLSVLILVLALIAAEIGLIWREGPGTFSFPTPHDEIVELYGKGIYRNDSLLIGAGFRGQDVVTLFLGCPLLAISVLLYRRASVRGGLMLTGILAYFLYVYASMALSAFYNDLFIMYVALFSASLFAFSLALRSIDPARIGSIFETGVPRKGLAGFMAASGVATLIIWLPPPLIALLRRQVPPTLDHYTTTVTFALDLAIIVPATLLAAVLLWRRDARGYLVAFPLLFLVLMLAPVIVASTISQVSAGVEFGTAEIAGPIGGFVTLGLVSSWFIFRLLKRI